MSNESVGKVFMDLETNTGPFQKQLNGIAGKSTNMVTSAFKGLGRVIGGVFAVKTLVNFGKASIGLASDLSEVQNVVDVVFGNSASQINNFAKTAITQYGLSELAAKQYSSTMGAMLKSMGLSQDAVLGMSQSITALTGDMASFYNLDSDTAFSKIRAGISGETEPLKQLGINMSVANMEAFALSQGITKSYQSMTQAEQALLRYNYLLSTTKDAQGDFARTSDSWANQTRVLSEQWKSFQSTMGTAFIAVLTPVVKMLNWIIAKLQIAANYFKAFIEAVTGVKSESSSAASGLGGIADSATEAGDATVEAAKKASKALAGFDKLNVLSSDGGDSSGSGSGGSGVSVPEFNMGDMQLTIPEPDVSNVEATVGKIKSMFSALGSFITTAFAPTITAWSTAFGGLGQSVTDAFSVVSSSISGLWNETLIPFAGYLIEEYAPSMVNTLSETLAPIFTDVLSVATQEWADMFAFACEQTGILVNEVIIPALDLWKSIFMDLCVVVQEEWARSGSKLLEGVKKLLDSVKEIWRNLYNTILKPIWNKILHGLDNLWKDHLKPLWDSIVKFAAKLVDSVLTIWNEALAPFINWVIKTFGPAFVNIFDGIWDTVLKVAENLISSVKNIIKALGGLLDFLTGVFTGDWKKAWEGIKTFFKGLWDGIVDVVKAPINLIIGFINAMVGGIVEGVNTAIRSLNKLSFTVPDWVPGIGGERWGFSIKELTKPKIPYLARGGIIDQPTLAMVGEKGKEAVVPLENTAFADSIANAILKVLAPLFANSNNTMNNTDGSTTIVLKIGEYELGRITVGAINKYHNVIGKVELEV